MDVGQVSGNNYVHSTKNAVKAESPAKQNSTPGIANDQKNISNLQTGNIPATQSFSSGPIKLLNQKEVAEDLKKLGYEYGIENAQMADMKVEGDNVTYSVVMPDPSDEEGEGNTFTVQFTGTLNKGNIVDRTPTFDAQVKRGGEIADGLNVKNIRFGAQADGSERVVFDIKGGGYAGTEAVDVQTVGKYEIYQVINKDGTASIIADINGIRAVDADSKGLKGRVLKDIGSHPIYDDSAAGFKLNFDHPVEYSVKTLLNPARLIIDFTIEP